MNWKDATERAQAYAAVFTSPEGERVLEDMKHSAFFYSSTYDAVPHAMGIREGRRLSVVDIENLIASAITHRKESHARPAGSDPIRGQSEPDPDSGRDAASTD
jgi:hypothetical protein